MPAGELRLVIEPDPEEPDAAEVLVDGFVAGRPYTFLLDTGAAQTSLVHDELTATFAATRRVESSGVFAVGGGESITIPRLEIGPILVDDFVAVRGAAGSPHERSLIGMDLLRDYSCRFDFARARVLLARGSTPQEGPLEELILDARFHPYVKVEVGMASAMAVWDTGASITVVDRSFVERNPERFVQAGTSRGTDSSGATVETQMFTMSGAVLGGRTFAPHRVAVVDLSRVNATIEIPMDMILGYNVLRQAEWLMDFPGRRWSLS